MARVLVTVGMSPWPFDRLVAAAASLADSHEVFVQTGTSAVRPPCPHAAFVPFAELQRRIAEADVVVTHAGNTVRLVQRAGRVPIAVARRAPREMRNDHQHEFLAHEERTGRIVAVWDTADLAGAVAVHRESERRLLAARPLPPPRDPEALADELDRLCARLVRRPRSEAVR